jgi:hydrogenase-4 component E
VNFAIDLLLVLVLLSDLTLLGSSRFGGCIRLSAVQGVLLGLLPLLVDRHGPGARLLIFAVILLLLKGYVFPRMLMKTLRTAGVRQEVEPLVGYAASVLLGVGILALSFGVASRLVLPRSAASSLVLPAALSTILIGLFLIVARRKALMQVVGYLVLENGIAIFGIAVASEEPFLVETGILLDVFVAVFVMGIAMFHISREFDHIDVDQLTSLKG